MIVKNYETVGAEPVTDAGAQETTVRWVIAENEGAKNFFMRIFEIAPGGCTPLHRHSWEHEMFVFEGRGCIVREGKEVAITKGFVIFVPSDEEHQVRNNSGEPLKLVCLIPAKR